MAADRTERLLNLVATLLGKSEPVPFAELRELFPEDYAGSRESAERKLERDKAELLQIGVPLDFVAASEDSVGGYRIDRSAFFLREPKLTPEEAAALYAAGSAALEGRDTGEFPFAQDLAHALHKIALAGSGPQLESAGGAAAARRLLVIRPGDPSRSGKLKVLATAVASKKRVRLAYRSAGRLDEHGEPQRTERWVRPFGLAFRAGAWRLVAWCELREGERTFVVDRIERLEVNTSHPNQADFEIPQGFDAGAAAGKRPWEWSQDDRRAVVVRFAPGSELLAERDFDGPAPAARLELQVAYLDGLVRHVLSFGDRAWIEGPEEARERIRTSLDLLERHHASPPDGADGPATSKKPEAPLPPKSDPPSRKKTERERLRRLLLIVPAARRRPGIKVAELAHELGLDPSDLLADIDLLSMVGRPPFSPDDLIDIAVDDAGRVTVTLDQSFSRPPQLTAIEALALAAGAQEVAPSDPAVLSALAKLTEQLPAPAQELYRALANRVATSAPPPHGTDQILAQLRTAAEARLEVVLEYDKEGRGAAEERPLRPLAVVEHAGRWYVMGPDLSRGGEERTFRIDRVRGVRETNRHFDDPGLDPARFHREEMFFPTGREKPVLIRFSGGAAAWALLRFGSRAQALADGSAEVTIDSAGTRWAVSLALSFAGEAEIRRPPEARKALLDEVARTRLLYAKGQP